MAKKMNKVKDNNPLNGEIIIYENAEGQSRVSVRVEGETVWLNQAQMVDLFQSSKANVSEHIKHIFEEGELKKDSVVRKFRTTALDGKNYNIEHYNLDMIISLPNSANGRGLIDKRHMDIDGMALQLKR